MIRYSRPTLLSLASDLDRLADEEGAIQPGALARLLPGSPEVHSGGAARDIAARLEITAEIAREAGIGWLADALA